MIERIAKAELFGFGALGFAQRSLLVLLSLFLLAPSTCRPRSVGTICASCKHRANVLGLRINGGGMRPERHRR
jgi:hypothetical protein